MHWDCRLKNDDINYNPHENNVNKAPKKGDLMAKKFKVVIPEGHVEVTEKQIKLLERFNLKPKILKKE